MSNLARHVNLDAPMTPRPNLLLRCLGAALPVAVLAACSGDDDEPAPVQMACTAVTTTAVNQPGLTVVSAAEVAAGGVAGSSATYPAHCLVKGKINERTGLDAKPYAIGYEIRLPASGWNGKFFYSGDGGLDGVINDPLGATALGGTTNALQLGYAVAASDGGHVGVSGVDGAFGQDPQARADYGYNALGTLTPIAKKIVGRFYGVAPSRSYYTGCSKGGQSGLMAASRFADQFDGIIAGDPGMDLPRASIAQLFDAAQFATVDANIANAFAPADLAFVAQRIRERCDALDGAADGMVLDTAACQASFDFNADVPQCASGISPNGSCLSAAQKTALARVFGGPKDSAGTPLYADWPWDPGVAGADWTFWKVVLNPNLGSTAMGNVWGTPPVATIDFGSPSAAAYAQAFDIDQALALITTRTATFTESSLEFMGMPAPLNLATLKAKGKLLVYHGTADPVFSSNYTRNWYDALRGGDPAAADYARFFLVPGMNHCAGGPATDAFDAFSALVAWVEQGKAPDSIEARVAPNNADKPAAWSASRSRPLCAYPKNARLKARATDLESASSFACE
jgi:hypothetical protein